MNKLILSLGLCALVYACKADDTYKVIAPVPVDNGETVYLTNFDTSEKVDSAVVANNAVTFTGSVDEPYVARIVATNGSRLGTFIVEPGTIAINPEQRRGVGNMLNDEYNSIQDSLQTIANAYNEAEEADRPAILQGYHNYLNQQVEDNMDSPIGYLLFLDMAYEMPVDVMIQYVEAHPNLKAYKRVNNLMAGAQRKLETSPGKDMVDFEVEYNGQTQKLSDYVGNGDYALVDFWASWCGPCVREIKTLKEINDEWGPKGLKTLGVAVWDKPEDTEGAIERLQIPWPVILNSGNIATDAYGIPAIPCIILFGPDGKILARDLTGQQLKDAVAEAMNK